MGGIFAAFLLAAAVAVFALTGSWFECSRDEVARLKSPSGDLQAVIFETAGGATTDFGYEIHIISANAISPSMSCIDGQKDAAVFLYGPTTSGQYGFSLQWVEPDRLSVTFENSRGSDLLRPTFVIGQHNVTVSLEQIGYLPEGSHIFRRKTGLTQAPKP